MSLWHLLQTTDSLFPTGAFSHSGGLEGLAGMGLLGTADQAERAVVGILERSFAGVDLPACALAHGASGDAARLIEIDLELDALKTPLELREASQSLGRRRLRNVPALEDYRRAVERDETPGHQAVVTGMHLARSGVPRAEALLAFTYGTAAGLVTAAMKLVPLGQSRAQGFLAALGDRAPEWIRRAGEMGLEDLGCFCPGLDIASMRHESAAPRLFIS
ncbi:MAG TPA: urease accessory UreF family protein [Planctomycetota bacterium]|nr:urease accessory UreF family protein [Planctomycetota bacterium]